MKTSFIFQSNNFNLYNAIKIGNENEVISMIEKYPYLLDKFIYGFTPLMIASSYGELSILIYLFYKGANINLQNDSDNWTALYFALINGHIKCAFTLIQFGCDISLLSSNNRTAFEFAMQWRSIKEYNLLLFYRSLYFSIQKRFSFLKFFIQYNLLLKLETKNILITSKNCNYCCQLISLLIS